MAVASDGVHFDGSCVAQFSSTCKMLTVCHLSYTEFTAKKGAVT